MKKTISLLTLFSMISAIFSSSYVWAQSVTNTQIVREKLKVNNFAANPQAQELIAKLEKEIAKMKQAGHLMPFRIQYGEGRVRYEFEEPWMVMYSLTRAYPYVSPQTQADIVAYIKNEIQVLPPWSNISLDASGSLRQGDTSFPPSFTVGEGLPTNYKRRGPMLYALWIYGTTTGNWSDIQPQWSNLQTIYGQMKSGLHTYELLTGAIAMARLAKQFGSTQLTTQYENDALSYINEGLDFDVYRKNAHLDYGECNQSTNPNCNWIRGNEGVAFPLFHVTPEAARLIANNTSLKSAVTEYVEGMPASISTHGVPTSPANVSATWIWPLWWMAQGQNGDWGYFDEGNATDPEIRMMLFTYFAKVKKDPVEKLNYYLDVPDALIGDLYYLQNLVSTIEAAGQTCWVDIWTNAQTCETIAPSATPGPTSFKDLLVNWQTNNPQFDLNSDGKINSFDFAKIIIQNPN